MSERRNAAGQIVPNANGFWLFPGNSAILTCVDVHSEKKNQERKKKCRAGGWVSHHLAMWHRWGLAIRRQSKGLGELRCWSVAPGTFGKAAPLETEKRQPPPSLSPTLSLSSLNLSSSLLFPRSRYQDLDLKCLQWKFLCRFSDARKWRRCNQARWKTMTGRDQGERVNEWAH